nr:replication-associated protein B [Faeces associated gemycircularvirus 6]
MLFVNSRYVLLTYAQCGDLDPWSVSNHLSALGAECIVAREIHPTTGGVHLHCFADFNRKFRSRSARIFDVDGRHPNVEPSRGTPEKGYDYAIKDGDVAAGGLERPEPRGGMSRGSHAVSNVAHLCEDTTEFLELYDEMDRGGLIAGFNNVRAYADWRFRPEPVEYASPDGAHFRSGATDGRDDWVVQSRIGDELPFVSAPVANAPFAGYIFCLFKRTFSLILPHQGTSQAPSGWVPPSGAPVANVFEVRSCPTEELDTLWAIVDWKDDMGS